MTSRNKLLAPWFQGRLARLATAGSGSFLGRLLLLLLDRDHRGCCHLSNLEAGFAEGGLAELDHVCVAEGGLLKTCLFCVCGWLVLDEICQSKQCISWCDMHVFRCFSFCRFCLTCSMCVFASDSLSLFQFPFSFYLCSSLLPCVRLSALFLFSFRVSASFTTPLHQVVSFSLSFPLLLNNQVSHISTKSLPPSPTSTKPIPLSLDKGLFNIDT